MSRTFRSTGAGPSEPRSGLSVVSEEFHAATSRSQEHAHPVGARGRRGRVVGRPRRMVGCRSAGLVVLAAARRRGVRADTPDPVDGASRARRARARRPIAGRPRCGRVDRSRGPERRRGGPGDARPRRGAAAAVDAERAPGDRCPTGRAGRARRWPPRRDRRPFRCPPRRRVRRPVRARARCRRRRPRCRWWRGSGRVRRIGLDRPPRPGGPGPPALRRRLGRLAAVAVDPGSRAVPGGGDAQRRDRAGRRSRRCRRLGRRRIGRPPGLVRLVQPRAS